MSIDIPLRLFVAVFLVAALAAPIAVLFVSRRPEWGAGRAHEVSMRARLPFGSAEVARSVAARSRLLLRVSMWTLLGAIAAALVFVVSPLDVKPYIATAVVLVFVLTVLSGATAVVCVRERLFAPVPLAPRVARAVSLTMGDYLDPWRRFAPAVLLFGAAAGFVALGITATMQSVAPGGITVLAVVSVCAAAVYGVGLWAERRVLDQPQPASNTLELAWDDLFRTDALSNLRMGEAIAAWAPLGWTGALLFDAWVTPGSFEPTAFLPFWGITMIQILYPFGTGKLRPNLYPAELRRPAWRQGAAPA